MQESPKRRDGPGVSWKRLEGGRPLLLLLREIIRSRCGWTLQQYWESRGVAYRSSPRRHGGRFMLQRTVNGRRPASLICFSKKLQLL
jgi:hypothetical protein